MPEQNGSGHESVGGHDGAHVWGDHLGVAGGSGPRNVFSEAAADSIRRAVCSTLSRLLLRDDGWLRIIPPRDGGKLYIKWKYTRGRWAGFYTMAVCEVWAWDTGVGLLADKLEQVDLGLKVPTRDRTYEDS